MTIDSLTIFAVWAEGEADIHRLRQDGAMCCQVGGSVWLPAVYIQVEECCFGPKVLYDTVCPSLTQLYHTFFCLFLN